jgi:DNA-binding FadR family transcriptional regulator
MLIDPADKTLSRSATMQIIPRLPGERNGISKRTIKEQISDKLAYMIHSGLLRVGDELPSERELATTLGVSRETVRAAIGILQVRRMIEINQGARTRVLGTGPFALHETVSTLGNLRERSFAEVAEARDAVEVQVIRLAAQRIRAPELKRLTNLVRDQEAMFNDPVRFQISDREFHSILYEACRNTLLKDVAADFYDYALEYRRRAMQRPGAIARSVADHQGIVAALKLRSSDAAEAAAHAHLEQVRKTTLVEMGR